MANISQLRRRALLLDGLALVIGLVLLFLGAKEWIPSWVQLTGLIVAFVLIVFSVIYLLRVRRLERQMLQDYIALERQQRRKENDVEPGPEATTTQEP